MSRKHTSKTNESIDNSVTLGRSLASILVDEVREEWFEAWIIALKAEILMLLSIKIFGEVEE